MEKQEGSVYRPDWITIAVWFAVGFLLPGVFANGESWVPTVKHMKARHHGDDCSIYRRLAKRASDEIKDAEGRLSYFSTTLQKTRAEVETCAKARGVKQIKSESDETLAAELCPTVYEAWLAPGYRMQAVKDDMESAKDGLRKLRSHIDFKCSPLPAGYKPELFQTETTVAPEMMPTTAGSGSSISGSATNLVF